jgi:thiamine pyrophosphokinase
MSETVARRSRVAVVVGGGGPPEVPPGGLGDLGGDVVVVAADSGLAGAGLLGLPVDLVVGDMDSVEGGELAAAVEAGVPVERHPVAKDATDLDLALAAALARRPRPGRLVVVTGTGDRFDHALAVALALASPRYAGVEVEAWIGPAHLWVVRDRATLRGAPGALVSLLPAHGPAGGVTTDGLLYPLAGEDLPAGSTRGVSNEMTGDEATVRVGSGVLLAVMPGGVGAPAAGVPRSPPWT